MPPVEQNAPDAWRRGFLLTQEWEDTAGGCLATYWGKGEDGAFCLRVAVRPVLFVPQGLALPDGLAVVERRPLALRTFARQPVDALYFARQGDLQQARDRLGGAGVLVCEGDINPSERHLMERFIHAACAFAGAAQPAGGALCYEQPRMQRAEYVPRLSRLSFDIETGSAHQLYTIACHFRDGDREERHVYVAAHGRHRKGSPATFCGDEAGALTAFLDLVRRLDPDLLCGWNIIGYDLPFLSETGNATGVSLALGRDGGVLRLFEGGGGRWSAQLAGRVVVDGIPALKGAFFEFEDFRLETVSRDVLGAGKLLDFAGQDTQAEIDRLFREDKEQLAAYNLRDAELVDGILAKTGLVDLLVSRSLVSGMLLERLGRSVAAFDHFFLPRLHRKGFVAPDRSSAETGEPLSGGLVLPPQPGMFEHVVIFDFRSLYPSIIRTFHICPYAGLMADTNPVRTPTGAAFSATEHILPDYIAELMAVRARAKAEGQAALAQAVKILMNSFYGVLGTPACRFNNPVLALSITGTGQWILRTARDRLEARSYHVLYGDTDSLFVQLHADETDAPHAAAGRIAAAMNAFLAEKLRAAYGVESALELEFQRYCRRFYLPSARNVPHALPAADEPDPYGHAEGAAKRYAGLVLQPDGCAELLTVGLECVRSDWTPLARRVQRELLERVFHEQPFEEWLRQQVRDLRAGLFDRELAYHRRLRKPPSAYTHNQPPHVKAMLQLPAERQRPGAIEYVMTRRGPVPLELPHGDVDYEHYVDRQLRPVVEDILAMRNHTFEGVIRGEEQMRLF